MIQFLLRALLVLAALLTLAWLRTLLLPPF